MPAAFDVEEFEAELGKRDPNDRYAGARVYFDVIAVENEAKTEEAGRVQYDNVEHFIVQWPGQEKQFIRAKDWHRKRYAAEYKAFKQGLEIPESGLPLQEWGMIPASTAKEFKLIGIHTVEQLADLSEGGEVYRKLGPAQSYVTKAKDFVKRTEKEGKYTALQAQNRKLTAEVGALREQIQMLSQRIEAEQGAKAYGSAA